MTKTKEFFVVNYFYTNGFTDKTDSKRLFISDNEDKAYKEYLRIQEDLGYGVRVLHTALEFLVFELKEELNIEQVVTNPDIINSENIQRDYLLETTGIYIKDSDWYYSEVDRLNPTIIAMKEKEKRIELARIESDKRAEEHSRIKASIGVNFKSGR